jgi:DNA repair exonuclease SbcCD ATPase subunit
LNKVCKELEEKVTQQQKQIDKTESNKRRRLKPAETKEPKHPVGGRMGISPHFSSAPPTSSQTLPARGSVRDVNTYEDFQKKVMPEILYASLPNQVTPSSAGTRVFGPVRKARSETDLRESELEKELKSMHVDNSRLRDSEKKLRKDNSQLQRKCKTLEKERDKAEDRLQVEQSNRDSLAKLRKRNEELEKQLKIICQEEVWKKRHQDVQDVLDSVTMDESKSVDQPLAVDSNDNSQAHLPPSQQ